LQELLGNRNLLIAYETEQDTSDDVMLQIRISSLIKEFSFRFYKNRCVGEFFSEAELPCSIMLMQLNFTLAKHSNKAKLTSASQSLILGENL